MVQPWHSALFLLYLSGIQEVLIFRNSSSPSRLAIGQLLHPLLRYTSPKRMHGQKENSPGWKFCYACYFCNIYLIFFNFSKKKKGERVGRAVSFLHQLTLQDRRALFGHHETTGIGEVSARMPGTRHSELIFDLFWVLQALSNMGRLKENRETAKKRRILR